MKPIFDCLVSYFGLDENGQAGFGRYFCYHILAGPGPAPNTGIAAVTAVAIHDQAERCTSYQNFHVAETGGPAAAMATAIRYLDAYHREDHLWKVQSDPRTLDADPPPEAAATRILPSCAARPQEQLA